MTTNVEEETNPPEMAEIVRLDGSAGRAMDTKIKIVGSNPTPVEVSGLRLLALPDVILISDGNIQFSHTSNNAVYNQTVC